MNWYLILLAALGCFFQGMFIKFEHDERYVPAVIGKGTASLYFVTIGIIGFTNNTPSLLVLIGLILGLVGDVFLNLRFVFPKIGSKIFLIGVASFLIGHILYICAIVNSSTPWVISLIAGIIVAFIVLTIIFKVLEVKLSYKIFGILYLGAVSIMASMAIGNYVVIQNTHNLIYALGALMFFISDIVLIFNSFGKTPKFSLRITNLTFYYIGQLLIAFSLFF